MSQLYNIIYMDAKDIPKLIEKYKNGTLSPEENDFLDAWYLQFAKDKPSTFNPDHLDENIKMMWDGISESIFANGIPAAEVKTKKSLLWPRIAAAACILLISGITVLYFKLDKRAPSANRQANLSAVTPGGNKAFLTLSDGSKISLSDARNGELANQSGIEITKTADGQLIYKITDQQTADRAKLAYNTIETPKGGQFQINLPDGSKVWMNAASTLKYPVSFASAKTRTVELNGEAYFEVAKDKVHPFQVKTIKQEIEVLGTHFNVNSYADDLKTKTTLMEGSVRIKPLENEAGHQKGLILKPGQQATLANTSLSVKNIDTEDAIAWKNGQFMFKNEPIFEVMKQISRWYNVEIAYQGNFSDISIGGSVSKFANISEVLEILELTGKIRFKIDGRKITITRLNE